MKEKKQKPAAVKKRVLVVEDEYDLRQLAVWLLEAEGYEALQAADGDAGLKIASEQPLDLVLLDIRMPGRYGWDVLTAIKESQKLCDLPVIILTASADADNKSKAVKMGAADYLIKPISAEKLVETVSRILENMPVSTDVP